MTYGEFLMIFLGVPLLAFLLFTRLLSRPLWVTLGILSLLALLYTGPWDNLIIVNGVWSYGQHRVIGLVIGHVPLEEFLFYVLQVLLAGFVMAGLLRWRAG